MRACASPLRARMSKASMVDFEERAASLERAVTAAPTLSGSSRSPELASALEDFGKRLQELAGRSRGLRVGQSAGTEKLATE